ncbi:MAG: D-2-hydroxyacid dehydrogenase [Clostridiales bacterium]|nr:D-2-hydroxyacid dehydrogenase [Clostridiales bacterium]
MRIVFTEVDTLGNDVDLSIFEEFGQVIKYTTADSLSISEKVKDADIIIANKAVMNEDSLKNAANVKLICLTATGTNNIDFAYTNKRGIAVANVKGYSTASVVQHTFALLFYVYEKLDYFNRFVKSGEYTKHEIFTNLELKFHELSGKTWGIIGLGDIGRGVARVAKAFGCDVIYYSTSGKNINKEYKQVDFDELLAKSDIISIHAPLNDATRNLIDNEALSKMKESAILLNLGRGPIIDEAALADALENNIIAGAGLDVLAVEPMDPNNPLRRIEDNNKLIITPHVAWATVEARQRCCNEVYENIRSFLSGGRRNIVEG